MLKKIFFLSLFSLLIVQCDIPASNDTLDPHVELIFPREGNVISTNIQIRIKAADNEKIEKVWAYVDGKFIGETSIRSDTSQQYSIPFNITNFREVKEHYIQVGATDNSGNFSSTLPENFFIAETNDNVPPEVQIVNPLSGQTVQDTVRILAVATDDREVQKVAFFIDGDSVAVDFTYPYSYDWNTVPYADGGTHSLYAKAYDLSGNSSATAIYTVTVPAISSDDIIPPVVTILYPLSGITINGTIDIIADVIDNRSVDYVNFYIDGVLLSKDTNGIDGWSANWNTSGQADNNSHSVYVKAYDGAGNIGAAFVTVTVSP